MEKRAKKYYAFRAQKVEDLKGAEKKAAKARGYKPEDWVMIMLSYNNRVLKFDVKKIDSEMLIGLKADLEAENFSISKRIDNIYISTKAGLRLNKEEFNKVCKILDRRDEISRELEDIDNISKFIYGKDVKTIK